MKFYARKAEDAIACARNHLTWRRSFERLDGLGQLVERKAVESQAELTADQRLLYALVKDHNRRLRAMERLERKQRGVASKP